MSIIFFRATGFHKDIILRLNSKSHCIYLETGLKWLQQFKFYGTVSNPLKKEQVNINLVKELSLK